MRKITKLFSNTSVKSIDEAKRQATFIISTDEKDRYNEVVEQNWDLEHYKANPIVLFGHNSWEAEAVMGKAIDITTEKDGDRTITKGTVQFAEEGTSKTADTVWSLVKQGILKTVSVGFIPHTFKDGDKDTGVDQILSDNELLEFSIVPIPANPKAVALAFGDGSIEEKDAKWLIKAYKAEQQYLEKSLYDTMKSTKRNNDNEEEGKVKAMTDEDIAKIAEAVGTAVAEAVAPLSEKLDAIAEAVKAEDEGTEDEGTQDEGDKEKSMDDKAKSEQSDEDGAEEDEDEELDEEAQKAFLAELEKEYKEIEGEE